MSNQKPRRFFAVTCLFISCWLCGERVDSARAVRTAGRDLQAVLDAAQPGDTILLEPATTYTGNFVLPLKDGDETITIQTAVDGAAAATGTRMTPQNAAVLAKIRTPNVSPALRTAAGAHHWRLLMIEVTGSGGDLIRLGDGGASQDRPDEVPHDLTVDRCYIHPDVPGVVKRGIALNSASTRIVNSYIAGISLKGQESQAIAGWNGPGPFVLENNYLEASGVNLMFGGADPALPNLTPSDIVIRRNVFSKRLEWRTDGGVVVKNLLELKNARHVTIEANVFERNWLQGQAGSAIVIKSWNQDGGAPWSVVEDVAVQFNVVRHVASAFNILGRSYDHPSGLTRAVTIAHNLAYDISGRNWGGQGRFLLVGDGAAGLSLDHNTVLQDGTFVQVYGTAEGRPLPVRNARITNNLALHNDYGVKGDGRSTGNDTLAAYFPDVVFRRNVLAGGQRTRYPGDNDFPDVDDFLEQFRDPDAGDYRLKTESRYREGATDGGPLGADVERIQRCLSEPTRSAPPTFGIRRPDTIREETPRPRGNPTSTSCQ